MSELYGDNQQGANIANDVNAGKTGVEGKFPTDVEGIEADGVVKKGIEEFPVFDVSPEDFFNNMSHNRRRIRFKSGSKVSQYINQTKNGARPIYIKTKMADNKEYTRKIK